MRKGVPSWIAKATRSYSPNRSQTKTPIPKMTMATNIITIPEVKTSAKRYRTIESGSVDRVLLARGSTTIPANMRAETETTRSEEHTSELQSPYDLVCRLLLEKKKK